jgi:2-polyprenyl-6-methoxyphenol hydroxylase-like FAD-dependent oxidoreductase
MTTFERGAVQEVPVLVIGGSLVGLATSMFLAKHGVKSVAVEKHRGTAIHPRAGYFQLRTMEIMREAGIEAKVRAAALALYDADGGMNAVETLAGREIAQYIPNINQGVADISPARRLFMPQQVLEPIIHDRAVELGAEFQYSTELVDFSQDSEGVTAIVRDVDSLEERTIRARYMVSCDGNRSPVRERLGIAMKGHGLMSRSVTIYFRADCSHALRGRNLGVIYVANPKVSGFFRLEKTGLGGFLVIFLYGDVTKPESRYIADTIDQDIAVQIVRDAVGEPDLDVKVEDVAKWRAVAEAAETFQQGRIFIAGDAAHTMPPTGGFGGNTGIQDAHNIAWKLAMATQGKAGAALVDTYNHERQPAGAQAIEQAYNRYVLRSDPTLGTEGMQPAIPDPHVEFNRYRSRAVAPEIGYQDDGRGDINPRQSMGLPGTRAPHVALSRASLTASTLDLFGDGFVLLAGPDGGAWLADAQRVGETHGIAIQAHRIQQAGSDDSRDWAEKPSEAPAPFAAAYGIERSGAVLVRPDGYVAWRQGAHDARAFERLGVAVDAVLCRD